jgi:hypothetical protein
MSDLTETAPDYLLGAVRPLQFFEDHGISRAQGFILLRRGAIKSFLIGSYQRRIPRTEYRDFPQRMLAAEHGDG